MTDSITNQASDKPPPNVKVTFRDDLDIETQPEMRRAAERSVATFVARMEEAVAQDRAAQAERAKLEDALNTPLMKLIKEDPAASKTLEDLRSGQLIDLDSTNELRPEQPLTAPNDVFTVPFSSDSQPTTPPYHFQWSFFNGDPPHSQILDRLSGAIGLDARSGSIPEGAGGFVEASAGFGKVLDPVTRMTRAYGYGRRVIRFAFQAAALGIGSNATTEGGTHIAAFEDGRMLSIAIEPKLWRARVSGFDESAHGGRELFSVLEPFAVGPFTMFPGHTYTLNVGIQVFADHTSGIGQGAAESLIQGPVPGISVAHLVI